MTFHDLWNTYPFLTRMLTAIGLGTGAIVGVAQAWPLIEPWMVAHRGYVTSQVSVVQATTNDLLRWKLEDAKSKLQADREGWAIQLQKENDPQTKVLIEKRIEQLKADERQNNERLGKLPPGS